MYNYAGGDDVEARAIRPRAGHVSQQSAVLILGREREREREGGKFLVAAAA